MAVSIAVPTSLFISFPALFFGFLTQVKLKNVQFNLGNRMILSAIPGTIIGILIGKFILTLIYNWIISLIFIIMGLILAYKYFTKNKSSNNNNSNSHNTKLAIILGFTARLMAGIGGFLSGGATVTAGLAIMGISAIKSADTSTYFLCIISIISLIAHLFTSSVAWRTRINLMIGAIIGAIITPLVLKYLNQNKLNKVFNQLLIYFDLKIII